MAQISDAISAVDAKIEVSANGTTWTDISGAGSRIDAGTQARMTGTGYTFDGDTPIITYGKREPITITVEIYYSEALGAFETLRAIHETENGGDIYVRWQPIGTGTGKAIYATGKAKLASFAYPSLDAASADPVVGSFSVVTGVLTRTLSA